MPTLCRVGVGGGVGVRAWWLSVLLVLCLSASHALAQNPLGQVVGTVRDGTGAILPGASVTLTSKDTGDVRHTIASDRGSFVFSQVPAGTYTVTFELSGFKTATYTDVKVDPAQEYALEAKMEVGSVAEAVQVTAGVELVHTTTTEVTNTVRQEQMLQLPLEGRDPINLIRLQAGVPGTSVRSSTAINGGRPTWTEVTQDGVNIQDNFIRTNSLDFVPNRPTPDNVSEFTIITNTQGVDAAGGASQVKLITPSGTNELHGSGYTFNRNSALSANSWFNNRDGIALPYLNRNQIGGRVGGPIIRNKLFFFGYSEVFRQKDEVTQNNRIPSNADFGSGLFRYRGTADNSVQAVNVLQLAGLQADPKVQQLLVSRLSAASHVNNSDVGDGLNTGGYRFNQTHYDNRNYLGVRIDANLSSSQRFEGIYQGFNETDDRTDIDAIHARPLAFTDSSTKLIVGAWRWVATNRLQNEFRAGVNLAPVDFKTNETFGDTLYNMPSIGGTLTSPVVTFQPQGRDTRTRQYIDSATYARGNHIIQFGGSLQQILVQPYNFAGQLPTVSFGFSAAARAAIQLQASQFPGGIRAADLATANAELAFLAGVVSSVSQTFEVRDRTSGFVGGVPNLRNYTLNDWAAYMQDSWRLKPNVTLRAGVKWEYFSPLKENANLQLLPISNGLSVRDTLLNPAGTVGFVNGGMYGKDLNNFGPSVGIAWDPSSSGKMAVRAAYTLAFVNEETLTVARNASTNNSGLETTSVLSNQYTTVGAGVPQVPTPSFTVPRSYSDQLATSATSAAFTIDPNIKQPYVHEVNVSVEREIGWNTAVEARYVGTFGRDIWRGVDYNQINAGGGFLDDFLRARQNGFLALASTGVFNPAYNAAIGGSQPLTMLPGFGTNLLANTTVRNLIQQGEVGSLADFYVTNRVPGAASAFFTNPNIYGADAIINGASTDYNALQLEMRRRFKQGLLAQVNYTWGKALSNSAGTSQARFEPFLDNARPQIERTRSEYDVRHVINANAIWELPFGEGRRFMNRGGLLDVIAGGWQLSGIMHWQSGQPLSFLAPRGTFNRSGRSGGNMAVTSLTRDQLNALLGVRVQPDGTVYYIDPSVIDPATGRGVGTDTLNNGATYNGQIFFNPTAGNLGTLQRLEFDGPPVFNLDASIGKRFRLNGRYALDFHVDMFNLPNHPVFDVADYNINSTTFGRITTMAVDARIVQISLKLNF